MERSKWIWMPHAGHFILGERCQFRLNTYVGKYIVSTVGELWSDRQVREIHASIYDKKWFMENKHLKGDEFDHAYMKKFGFEDIGAQRKYETMVFRARKSKYKCCPYTINVAKEMDFKGYNNDKDAAKGHYELCERWSKK